MIFVPALVGAFLPQTQLAKIENFCSLAYGKGYEKIHFFILTDWSDCAEIYRHQLIARVWGIAIPIKFVGVSKSQNELLAAKAKLALCFPPILLQQQKNHPGSYPIRGCYSDFSYQVSGEKVWETFSSGLSAICKHSVHNRVLPEKPGRFSSPL
jgi:hypothetical protein